MSSLTATVSDPQDLDSGLDSGLDLDPDRDPTVADEYRLVVGVDTHARQHSYAIITSAGKVVSERSFPTSPQGVARAVAWIDRAAAHCRTDRAEVLVSMESTGSHGAIAADRLAVAGYRVVEAPTPRRDADGKTDQIDARAAARKSLQMPIGRLRDRRASQVGQALNTLTGVRHQLTRWRTATINTLTALVRSHDLGLDARRALTSSQIREIAGWRARRDDGLANRIARTEAVRTARRILELDAEINANEATMAQIITEHRPALLELTGVGAITGAVILAVWSQPGRIRTEAALAKIAGTCPIPASSGNTRRHRLNRTGDRRLNAAIYQIVITRLSHDPATRAYRDRRLAEGRTPKEIRRCLKRYITRQIFRTLHEQDRKQALDNT